MRKGAVCIDADAPFGDMESAVKFTNRRCQSQFLPVSITKLSITKTCNKSLAHTASLKIVGEDGNLLLEAYMH